jgi:hypothetical protein
MNGEMHVHARSPRRLGVFAGDELYTQPWSGEFSMTRFEHPLYEYGCHEGDYSLTNALRGGQAEAARLAAEPPAGDNRKESESRLAVSRLLAWVRRRPRARLVA